MPQKLKPNSKTKSIFFLHVIVYAIGVITMVMIHKQQGIKADAWVYPWHAWLIAAWGLALIGHLCTTYFAYEDKGLDDFNKQVQNG